MQINVGLKGIRNKDLMETVKGEMKKNKNKAKMSCEIV